MRAVGPRDGSGVKICLIQIHLCKWSGHLRCPVLISTKPASSNAPLSGVLSYVQNDF